MKQHNLVRSLMASMVVAIGLQLKKKGRAIPANDLWVAAERFSSTQAYPACSAGDSSGPPPTRWWRSRQDRLLCVSRTRVGGDE